MTQPLPPVRIVFVGGGNMAAALIGGLLARGAGPASLAAIDPSDARPAGSSTDAPSLSRSPR